MFLHKKWSAAMLATLSFLCISVGVAKASGSSNANDATFMARYEHNAQIEAELLQQTQTTTGVNVNNPNVVAISKVVSMLNQQISSLYAVEETLSGSRSEVLNGSWTSAQRDRLLTAHRKLLNRIHTDQQAMSRMRRQHKNVQALALRFKAEQVALHALQWQMSHLTKMAQHQQHPFGGGLGLLQGAIYRLQSTVIRETNVWITLQSPSWQGNSPATINGPAYDELKVAVPSLGSAAIVDAVAAQPIVKDDKGQVLPAAGAYSLVRPAGAAGVTIDSVTGAITIDPGATRGDYEVVYSQGAESAIVILQVVR